MCIRDRINPALTSLEGFENISEVGLDVFLTELPISNLKGFENLKRCTSFLVFDTQINNVDELVRLEECEIIGFSNNELLTNLNGLKSLVIADIFDLTGNPDLSDCCSVSGILDRANPDDIFISENSFPCNGIEEILAADCNCTDCAVNITGSIGYKMECQDTLFTPCSNCAVRVYDPLCPNVIGRSFTNEDGLYSVKVDTGEYVLELDSMAQTIFTDALCEGDYFLSDRVELGDTLVTDQNIFLSLIDSVDVSLEMNANSEPELFSSFSVGLSIINNQARARDGILTLNYDSEDVDDFRILNFEPFEMDEESGIAKYLIESIEPFETINLSALFDISGEAISPFSFSGEIAFDNDLNTANNFAQISPEILPCGFIGFCLPIVEGVVAYKVDCSQDEFVPISNAIVKILSLIHI